MMGTRGTRECGGRGKLSGCRATPCGSGGPYHIRNGFGIIQNFQKYVKCYICRSESVAPTVSSCSTDPKIATERSFETEESHVR